MASEVRMLKIPDCDLCASKGLTMPAEYDAKTVMGPWAYMCGGCFSLYSTGQLGTGYGQRLVKAEGS